MLQYLLTIALALTMTGTVTASTSTITIKKKSYVPIELGKEEHIHIAPKRLNNNRYDLDIHFYANRKLRKRVRQLERAMLEMQEEMHEMHHRLNQMQTSGKAFACFIKTSFSGTHMGKGYSLAEAKAVTLQK
jgi:hypothetical protein